MEATKEAILTWITRLSNYGVWSF